MTEIKKTRRHRGDGGYRRRATNTWELKFGVLDPRTGARIMRTITFKGTETGARSKLRELVGKAEKQEMIPPAKLRFDHVIDAWENALKSTIVRFPFKRVPTLKTAERYLELVRLHIRPHLGSLKFDQVTETRLEKLYADLHVGRKPDGSVGKPLAVLTIGHVHRRVCSILKLAERDFGMRSNPGHLVTRPQASEGEAGSEIEILDEAGVADVLKRLRGHNPIFRIASLGLATGMRRGEILALRWSSVDLERGMVRVERSLEQTKGKNRTPVLGDGLRFKLPKTQHGRRDISLPPSIVTELRVLRREQHEQRLALGLGRDTDDALLFRNIEGAPLVPNSVSTEWRKAVSALELPKVSLHAWRHTHASQLIRAGLDIVTISRRLGHANPTITLNVYAHIFRAKEAEDRRKRGDAAVGVFETAFGKAFSD